jgi:GPH family glycoside/pentoside/hexuronide:cation symporter
MPNVEQSEEVLLTLRLLYALVPSVCNIVALIIALAYPISRKRHGEIRFAIAERKAGRSVTDPLRRERIMVS